MHYNTCSNALARGHAWPSLSGWSEYSMGRLHVTKCYGQCITSRPPGTKDSDLCWGFTKASHWASVFVLFPLKALPKWVNRNTGPLLGLESSKKPPLGTDPKQLAVLKQEMFVPNPSFIGRTTDLQRSSGNVWNQPNLSILNLGVKICGEKNLWRKFVEKKRWLLINFVFLSRFFFF